RGCGTPASPGRRRRPAPSAPSRARPVSSRGPFPRPGRERRSRVARSFAHAPRRRDGLEWPGRRAMDGVHDLGGMQGFGRVEREDKEPVFHAPWEAEVLAMMRAGAGQGFYNIDEVRHAIERMRPADYLAATYYAKWLDGIARLFVEKGVVTEAEMQARTAFFA